MPLVTIVIPTFNRRKVLSRAIESVRAQTISRWEIIVVDDASTEEVAPAVASLQDRRIRVVRHEKNRGGSAARNTGLDLAAAPYAAFLDSDDEWLPEKLERQLSAMKDHAGDAALLSCGMRVIGRSDTTEHVPTDGAVSFDTLLRRTGCVWDTVTLLVKTKEAQSIRFDESLPAYQDFDFCLRMCREFGGWSTSDVLVVKHFEESGPRVSDRNLQGRLCILDKYKDDLEKRPETHSHHHVRIALKYYHGGRTSEARRHLFRAASIYPRRLQHWFWWLGSQFGSAGLWLALRLFHHKTSK